MRKTVFGIYLPAVSAFIILPHFWRNCEEDNESFRMVHAKRIKASGRSERVSVCGVYRNLLKDANDCNKWLYKRQVVKQMRIYAINCVQRIKQTSY